MRTWIQAGVLTKSLGSDRAQFCSIKEGHAFHVDAMCSAPEEGLPALLTRRHVDEMFVDTWAF